MADLKHFIPDADAQQRRYIGEQSEVVGQQLVAEGIEGHFFAKTDISIHPDSITVVIGNNVDARNELVAVLAGTEPPVKGKVSRPKNALVEFVKPTLTDSVDPNMTIADYWKQARRLPDGTSLYELELELNSLYAAMATEPEALQRAGVVQEKLELLGGWSSDDDAVRIIDGLQISANPHDGITPDRQLGDLSSGQVSKSIIGRALFSGAGTIIMQDPSVHLDVASSRWLQEYVRGSNQAVVVTTSDMSFAEAVADKVVEVLDCGIVIQCNTGLEQYYVERERIITKWCDDATRKKQEIADLELHIRDFLAPAAKRTDNMAQVLRANYTKLERMKTEYSAMPGTAILDSQRAVKSKEFKERARSGTNVLRFAGYSVAYIGTEGETGIIEIQNELTIHRGDRVAVVGRNGSGKSTLLGSVFHPTDDMVIEGSAVIGASVTSGYYSPYTTITDQDHAGAVRGDTPLREALKAQGTKDAGGVMEYWGFGRTTDYRTTIDQLNGLKDAEARAQLAMIMANEPNLIVLDEPTSYLTPEYRDRLQRALEAYDGTLIVVSHDPAFLGGLAINSIIEMPGAKLKNL